MWGRVKNVDRTNELLLRNIPEPPSFQESIIGRVQAYTVGYDRDFTLPHLAIAAGAQLTIYLTPDPLKSQYGSHPAGTVMFLRVRPIGKQH